MLLWDIFPVAASREADIADEAFLILTVLAIPVMALVVVTLGYSVVKFRRRGPEDFDDGPSVRTHGGWVNSWLAWTAGLTVLVIIFPGITGIMEMRETEGEPAGLVVNVTGQRWFWSYEYEGLGVQFQDFGRTGELVLPVDKVVRFRVTAHPEDVLHSFWIPAFRAKIDAVPGLTTSIDVTPTELGQFNDDVNFRVQCAELCGANHATMFTRIKVVEQGEFDEWVAAKAG